MHWDFWRDSKLDCRKFYVLGTIRIVKNQPSNIHHHSCNLPGLMLILGSMKRYSVTLTAIHATHWAGLCTKKNLVKLDNNLSNKHIHWDNNVVDSCSECIEQKRAWTQMRNMKYGGMCRGDIPNMIMKYKIESRASNRTLHQISSEPLWLDASGWYHT